MESRLKKLKNDLRKKAGGNINPIIDKKRRELDLFKQKNEQLKLNIIDADKQISLASKEIEQYENRLKNSSDATTLDSRRKELIKSLDGLNKLYMEKNTEKMKFLQNSAKLIYLWPAIKDAI